MSIERRSQPSSPLLVTSGLSVRFGGLVALDRLDLIVGAGEVVGLIGPNGAGKTTAVDALTGFVPASGRIEFDGVDISALAPHERARVGLGRTWQSVELFDDLTVAENLSVGVARRSWRARDLDASRARRHDEARRVDTAVELMDIGDVLGHLPQQLSHGQRVLVGLARSLVAAPRLLCLDEPAAGLDATERAALASRLPAIIASGTAVLLIDHDIDLMVSVCDRLYALESGVVIAEGTPTAVVRDGRVVEAYLGRAR
jgi:branched-chain amino acid transport system ATP-binding protein